MVNKFIPREPVFGALATPTGAEGDTDASWYRQFVEDALFMADLGYEGVWSLEHHFSDYFPVPNPFVALSHIAALRPKLSLGTAVLITPWHNPVRVAGEIAMLTHLTDAPIRIGMGRGNAPLEYEAFGVEMGEARQRYQEAWEIIKLAVSGKPFTYDGSYLKVNREITLRPYANKKRLSFHGAIGHPTSARRIAELGLAPVVTSFASLPVQEELLGNWYQASTENGFETDVIRASCPILIIADSDTEAEELARIYIPKWYALQQIHYAFDEKKYSNVPGYADFNDAAARRNMFVDPAKVDPLFGPNLIGSPETVYRKAKELMNAGYNYFILNAATPKLPQEWRHLWLNRFIKEVAPLLQKEFKKGPQQIVA